MLPRKYHEHEKPPQNPPKTTQNPTQNPPRTHPKPPKIPPKTTPEPTQNHPKSHPKPPPNPPKTAQNPTQNRPQTHPKPPQARADGPAPRSMGRGPVGLFPPPLPSGLARRSSPSFPHGGAGFPPWVAPSGFPLFPPFGSGALASGSALCARVPVAFVRSRGLDLARPGRRPRLDAGDSGGERLPESPAEICCYRALYLVPPIPPPCFFFFFLPDHNPQPSRTRSRVKALAVL